MSGVVQILSPSEDRRARTASIVGAAPLMGERGRRPRALCKMHVSYDFAGNRKSFSFKCFQIELALHPRLH